jgi:hypothetical protein
MGATLQSTSSQENPRGTFEGVPGLRSRFFTLDDQHDRAMNFYI